MTPDPEKSVQSGERSGGEGSTTSEDESVEGNDGPTDEQWSEAQIQAVESAKQAHIGKQVRQLVL